MARETNYRNRTETYPGGYLVLEIEIKVHNLSLSGDTWQAQNFITEV